MALIQGTRRIADLARVQIQSAAGGTIAAVICYYTLGLRGLVPALLIATAIQFCLAWAVARRVPVPVVRMTLRESMLNARSMVGLGIAMMWTGLVGSAVGYGINLVLTHQLSLQALGIYSAAFALSGMFANFVLNAMGSDYYPRLAAVADDNHAVNKLVNEQTEVGLLLSVPGLVATLTMAPWIVQIFYTREFLPAATLLHWFTLGCLGRVISWPLGYLLMAKSRAGWLIASETSGSAIHFSLVIIGVQLMGLEGAAVAFFALYVVYIAIVFTIGRRLTGFAWSDSCKLQLRYAVGFLLVAFVLARIDSLILTTGLSIPLVAGAGIHSLSALTSRLGADHRISRLIARLPILGPLVARMAVAKQVQQQP